MICDRCGDDMTADDLGCTCDGITRCLACLCAACAQDVKDDMAAEAATDGGRR